MKYIFFLTAIVLLMWSCGNGTDSNQDDTTDTTVTEGDTNEIMNEVVYQVPSPDEYFSLLDSKVLKFKAGITHDDKKQYESRAGKELNMGVYISDLAYLNNFGEMKTAVLYFARVREMADQLGLSSAIPEQTMKKIDDNSSNPDSIRKISDESFFNVIQSLEESGNGKSLAFIMTAGWIETLYISLQLSDVKKFDYKNTLIQRICSQKVTYGNIIKNLERFQDNPDVKSILGQTLKLGTFFDALVKEEIEVKQDTTKTVIGKPVIWKTDNNQFKKFVEQVNVIRKSIVEQS